jgi:prevent-host-death family protein
VRVPYATAGKIQRALVEFDVLASHLTLQLGSLKWRVSHENRQKREIVVFALIARTNFGKRLRRVEDEHHSLVIEKRGPPKAVPLSTRDYVRASQRPSGGAPSDRRRVTAQGHRQAYVAAG